VAVATLSPFDGLRFIGGRIRLGEGSPLGGWSLLVVDGVDRERFVQSQITADLPALDGSGAVVSALLDRSGLVQSYFLVHRKEEAVWLLVPDELVEVTRTRLSERIIGDQVTVRAEILPPRYLVLGPAAEAVAKVVPEHERVPVDLLAERGWVVWPSSGSGSMEVGGGWPDELEPELVESLRVLTGLPRWGVELGERTLVNQTTLIESAVSFTKGCFLGQETVAKVASGRGALEAPMLIEVEDGCDADPGGLADAVLTINGARCGRVLAWARWQGRLMLQAALRREHRVEGRTMSFELDGALLSGTVRQLPLLRPALPQVKAGELHERASAEYARNREDEAVRLLELALELDPGHADCHESLGVILGRRGDLEGAVELMHRLLEVAPGSVMAHTNLSLYLSQMGHIAEAEQERAEAARAAALKRQQAAATAEAEEQEHRRQRAELERREQMLTKVLELDGDDPMARLGLGELCVMSGRFDEARQHLERALQQDMGYSAAFLALGKAFEGLNDRDSARLVYTRGVEVAARKGDLRVAGQMQERLATF